MEYKILSDVAKNSLAAQVEWHLHRDWRLQGGVNAQFRNGFPEYCQAITKALSGKTDKGA